MTKAYFRTRSAVTKVASKNPEPLPAGGAPTWRGTRVPLPPPLAVAICCFGLLAFGLSPFAHAEEDSSDARAKIQSLPAEEREQLRRKLERFEALSPEEQQRLRELESHIAADPKEDELRQTVSRYYEWLKTLTPAERAELAELSPTARLERIRQIRKTQLTVTNTKGADALSGDDYRELFKWLTEVAWRHKDELLRNVPEHKRKFFRDIDADPSKRWMLWPEMLRQADEAKRPAPITESDFVKLDADLSPPAREALKNADSHESKLQLIKAWLEHGRRKGPDFGQIRERVKKFFEELPEDQKQRILAIEDEHQRRGEIFRLFWEAERKAGRAPPPGHDHRGPPRDGRRQHGRDRDRDGDRDRDRNNGLEHRRSTEPTSAKSRQNDR